MAKTLNEHIDCWDFVKQILQSPRFGLIESRFLPEEYRKVTRHRYFAVIEREGQKINGVVRLIPHFDASQFQDVTPALKPFQNKEKALCEVGVYLRDSSELDLYSIFVLGYKLALAHAKAVGMDGLLVQVPINQANFFGRLGFKVVGSPYQPNGWSVSRLPMLQVLSQS